jgi:molybdate transport system substrate-binding protein
VRPKILSLLLIGLLISGCASEAQTRTLTVFAAASLAEAFREIGKAFEAANPGADVVFNFDGSQSLQTQIEQGAAADVFASASQKQMEALISQSLVSNLQSQNFAANQLVVILPSDNPANIQSLADLARPGLSLVLAAEDVPVGDYSRQILEALNGQYGSDYAATVLGNLVSEETNVKQIIAKVQLGEADAGIVYASDAVASPDLKTITIPTDYNVVAAYPIATLGNAPNRALAEKFVAYVLSTEGQATLKKWGFAPVAP